MAPPLINQEEQSTESTEEIQDLASCFSIGIKVHQFKANKDNLDTE